MTEIDLIAQALLDCDAPGAKLADIGDPEYYRLRARVAQKVVCAHTLALSIEVMGDVSTEDAASYANALIEHCPEVASVLRVDRFAIANSLIIHYLDASNRPSYFRVAQ